MRAAALAALTAATAGSAGAQALDCPVALVLAIDVSSSVDAAEHDLQMTGLAAAFRTPEVVETILAGEGAGIMATAFLWSGFRHQEVIAPWTWLGDAAAIEDFAQVIETAERRVDHWPTSLGRAAEYAAGLQAQNPVPCRRRVIDVSGDGANNDGLGPEWRRDRGMFEGLTINGLAIRGAEPDPEAYYRENLITGPGAFVEAVDGYDDYAPAILRKLLRELQPPFASNLR